jgi:hypothetical protein
MHGGLSIKLRDQRRRIQLRTGLSPKRQPRRVLCSTLIRLNRIKAQLLFESPLGSEKRSGTLLHGEVILKRMLRLGVTPRTSKLRRTSKSNSKTGLSVTGLGHVPGDRGLAIKPTSDTSAAIS